MGWASTADPASYLNIEFYTQEEAVRFCNEQGFHFMVQEPRREQTWSFLALPVSQSFFHSARAAKPELCG